MDRADSPPPTYRSGSPPVRHRESETRANDREWNDFMTGVLRKNQNAQTRTAAYLDIPDAIQQAITDLVGKENRIQIFENNMQKFRSEKPNLLFCVSEKDRERL